MKLHLLQISIALAYSNVQAIARPRVQTDAESVSMHEARFNESTLKAVPTNPDIPILVPVSNVNLHKREEWFTSGVKTAYGAPTNGHSPSVKGKQSRLILYHQTHRDPRRNFSHVSILPLARNTRLTHLYIGAFHLSSPKVIKLNDHVPTDRWFDDLWKEVLLMRIKRPDIKIMAMLGGAAQGFYSKLAFPEGGNYEAYYQLIVKLIRRYQFDGVDLDIEERYDLDSVRHLIHRLKENFGRDFLISLAPVQAAMQSKGIKKGTYKGLFPRADDSTESYVGRDDTLAPYPTLISSEEVVISPEESESPAVEEPTIESPVSEILPGQDMTSLEEEETFNDLTLPAVFERRSDNVENIPRSICQAPKGRKRNLSGFDYFALHESPQGKLVDWYNVQMYCGWGSILETEAVNMIDRMGWPMDKIVLGTVTSPEHGSGYEHPLRVGVGLQNYIIKWIELGGIFGWEYYHPSGKHWAWARMMECFLNGGNRADCAAGLSGSRGSDWDDKLSLDVFDEITDSQKFMEDFDVSADHTLWDEE